MLVIQVSQAKELENLKLKNSRLKKAAAELTLEKLVLKEALSGNY